MTCCGTVSEAARRAGPPPPPPGLQGQRGSGPGRRGRAGRSGPQQYQGRGQPVRQQPQGPGTVSDSQSRLQQQHSASTSAPDNQQQPVKVLQRKAAGADSVAAQPSGGNQSAVIHSDGSSARLQKPCATGDIHLLNQQCMHSTYTRCMRSGMSAHTHRLITYTATLCMDSLASCHVCIQT